MRGLRIIMDTVFPVPVPRGSFINIYKIVLVILDYGLHENSRLESKKQTLLYFIDN